MYLQRRENHLHRGVEAKRGEMSTDQPRGREWSLGPIQTGRKRRLAIKLQRRFLRAGLVGSRQFSLLFLIFGEREFHLYAGKLFKAFCKKVFREVLTSDYEGDFFSE